MKFRVEPVIFEKIPNACFGVVVAKGIDNSKAYPKIDALLEEGIAAATERFLDKKVKEEADIIPYREAFRSLDMNPNKYMCSIEAMFARISKGKGMPHINPLVDLNNAISLKYTLPMGTHDLSLSDEDIVIRLAKEGDTFIPFGAEETETPDAGEVVYAVGSSVRTRRWTWRQSEEGKIGPETSYVFFPIDGFEGFNEDRVLQAREELAELLKNEFQAEVITGYVNAETPEMEWE